MLQFVSLNSQPSQGPAAIAEKDSIAKGAADASSSEGSTPPKAHGKSSHEDRPPKALPTILVVEDDDTERRELAELLSDEGYPVQPVASGDGAVREVERPGIEIGAIVMDLHMPGEIDGIDAAYQIQKVMHRDIPTILVTAHSASPVYRRRVEQAKIDVVDWLDKPIDDEKLLGHLNEIYAVDLVRETYYAWSLFPHHTEAIKACVEKLTPKLIAESLEMIREKGPTFRKFTAQINFASYDKQKPELAPKYQGEYVAYLDGQLVEKEGEVLHSANKDELIRWVYDSTGRTDMFFTMVNGGQNTMTIRRPSRFKRS